ncbi:hypothetical protein M426DRAFT_320294 [Hypoxylon sp. CI-4A]|nr:hypothetical protein M426DRAFT_320294 [Hypoxylon sp. CI-4A]
MASPIAKLGPEILLEIFEWLSRHDNATLVPSILCCRKWRQLALSVLYSDVVLTHGRLARFVENRCTDHEIRSLTLRLDALRIDPNDPSGAKQAVEPKLEALRRLCPQITKTKLLSLSFVINLQYPFTASREIAAILHHLPASCESLEIDVRYGGVVHNLAADSQGAHLHLCDSIRAALPRLQHLRLRLPVICPAVFSAAEVLPGQAVRAPMLKTCIVNLSLRPPGPYLSQGVRATSCSDDTTRVPYIGQMDELPSALPSVVPALKAFARLNSENLERLWVLDVESRQQHPAARRHPWAAWVRRDFLSDASLPIPVANIGGQERDAWLARLPSPTTPGNTQDYLSFPDVLETLAEGSTWITTTSGARLPISMLREHQDTRRALTKAQFRKRSRLNCVLWRNEDVTGERLLPEGPGELTQRWDLNERMPSGWTRDDYVNSFMVRA